MGNLKNLLSNLRNKQFSSDSKQAIKNSGYQLSASLIMKLGSLIFTIVLARILLPEKMGLYYLALSTILLFSSFSDLGISTALLTFVSKSLGKGNPEKAKAYFEKLLRWKVYLLLACSAVLLALSFFIAEYYYKKPIFYALLIGGLYIPITGFLTFLEQSFKASNNFRGPLLKEFIFQLLRITIVPLGIFLLLNTGMQTSFIIAGVILSLTFCYLISLLVFVFITKKRLSFLKTSSDKLTSEENIGLKKFIIPLTATSLSGVFFGYMDTFLLGRFVPSEYIGYYSTAFALVASVSVIISFISTSVFPILSKLEGESLEKFFKKTRKITLFFSVSSGILTYLLASLIVQIAYGSAYATSIPILKYFAVLALIMPLSGLYDSYFISQRKTKVIAWLLISSTILNLFLNLIGITYGLKFSEFYAVVGAAIATVLSKAIYLVVLMIIKKKI